MKSLPILRLLLLGLVVCSIAAWAEQPKPAKGNDNQSLLYVGLANGQAVNVYQVGQNTQLIGQLLDGLGSVTGDMVVDNSQQVYTISGPAVVYPVGGLVPNFRYPFPDAPPISIVMGTAVDANGTFYGADWGDGFVFAYKKGKPAKALYSIPAPSGNTMYAVAVDKQKNVYVEYGPACCFPEPGHIEKCPPRSTQCTDLGITLGAVSLHLALDSQGNLLACDQLAAQIDIFPPGGGQPRVISQGLVGCPYFALSGDESQLYVANESRNPGNQGISVFDYAQGTLLNTITTGIPPSDGIKGVALSPADNH